MARFVEAQLAAVGAEAFLPVELNQHVAKRLVGAHDLAVAGPERDVVELHPLARHLAKQHGADAAIADGRASRSQPASVRRCGLRVVQAQVTRRQARRCRPPDCGEHEGTDAVHDNYFWQSAHRDL